MTSAPGASAEMTSCPNCGGRGFLRATGGPACLQCMTCQGIGKVASAAKNDHCRGCANGGDHDSWCPKASAAPRRRLRECVEAWPECREGDYNPKCCRFPKSCSCDIYDPQYVTEDDLEPMPDGK